MVYPDVLFCVGISIPVVYTVTNIKKTFFSRAVHVTAAGPVSHGVQAGHGGQRKP